MHNGQSERGTICSLDYWKQRHANALSTYTHKSPRTILPAELIISQAVHHVPELPVGPGGPGSPLGPATKMKILLKLFRRLDTVRRKLIFGSPFVLLRDRVSLFSLVGETLC